MNLPAVVNHSARAHSPIGGSSAKRVIECPGSVALCEKVGEQPSSEWADEGTACHEAVDLILMGKTKRDDEVIGLILNGIIITQELFDDGIAPALAMFDALDRELGGIEFFNEQRVVFPGIDGAFGTVDIVGAAKDRAIVLDWKFGSGVAVDAEQNAQLMYYAYAAMHTPPASQFFHRDKPVEVFIVQPRVMDGEPFTRWMTTTLQLEAFAMELRDKVRIAYEPDAPLALGPHCKFCPAKVICPLYNNLAKQALGMSREEMVTVLSEQLKYADLFIELGKTIKDMAHQALEAGASIPGWKLVNKRVTREWKDEAKTLKYFGKVGLPAAERHVKKILSPYQAEQALKKAGLPAELPAALVESKSSGTTLAPNSDKRPAIAAAPTALKALAERLSAR